MKTKETKIDQKKDRIDALVDTLDKYFFRIGLAENLIAGNEYGHTNDFADGVRALSRRPTGKQSQELFYENLNEVNPELRCALEDAAIQWQSAEETFPMIIGFILGLRTAGIDTERTKQMARTWRLDSRKTTRRKAAMFRNDEKDFLRSKLRKIPIDSLRDLRELIDEAKAEEGMAQPVELRDWFATHAPEPPQWWLTQHRAGDGDLRQLARWRWIWADAMLSERI